MATATIIDLYEGPLPAFATDDPSTVRAAALLRLSDMTDTTSSPERQEGDCTTLIRSRGWRFDPATDIFSDLGISGFKDVRRPALDLLVERLADYDVIVFWKLDRVFRSMLRFLLFLKKCEKAKVGLVSVKEPTLDTTSPVGRLLAYVLMAIAEMESANTSMRIRSAFAYLASQGYYHGGREPFGWRKAPVILDDGRRRWRLELDPDNAPIVEWMVESALGGKSLNAIARELNEKGVVARLSRGTAGGGPKIGWSDGAVKVILTNPVLLGQMRHHGKVVVDDRGVPIAIHDPLIDAFTWARLQEKISKRAKRPRSTNESLLKGLARCAQCDRPMHGNNTTGYYACRTKFDNPGICAGNVIRMDRIEELVRDAIFDRLRPEALAEAAAVLEQERQLLGHDDPAEARRAELTQALDLLEADRRAGLYSSPTAEARFRSQHLALSAELDQLAVTKTTLTAKVDLAELDLGGGATTVPERWEQMGRTDRRSLVLAVVEKIVVTKPAKHPGPYFHPERVAISWR